MGKKNIIKGLNVKEIAYFEVVREYQCSKCNEKFHQICKKIDKILDKKCPDCQNILSPILNSTTFFVNNIKTVGQLVDHNTKKMGHYEREEKSIKLEKDRYTAKKTAGVDIESQKTRKLEIDRINKINKMTPLQKTKYIKDGKI